VTKTQLARTLPIRQVWSAYDITVFVHYGPDLDIVITGTVASGRTSWNILFLYDMLG
jgi:hypothetical protein